MLQQQIILGLFFCYQRIKRIEIFVDLPAKLVRKEKATGEENGGYPESRQSTGCGI
jgi:hypothetical protein